MAKKLQIRRDTEANWSSNNPTLSLGEIGFEIDSNLIKVGDGSSTWTALSYAVPPDTDFLTEGEGNLYFTSNRAIEASLPTIQSASAYALSEAEDYSDAGVSNKLLISDASATYLTQVDASNSYLSQISACSLYVTNVQFDAAVEIAASASPQAIDINSQSSSYTVQLDDIGKIIEMSSASAVTLTIPNNLNMPVGFYFDVTLTGTGSITFEEDSGVTIRSENSQYILSDQYRQVHMYKRDLYEWVLLMPNPNLIMRSISGILYEVTVDDDGSLITTAI